MSWLLSFFGLGGIAEKVTVQLIPDTTARSLPGFHHGGLTLIATKGTTFETLLANFNAYRGPDSQIHKLYTGGGAEIPLRTVITEPVICTVRKI
jgi:hypothetical protein